MTWETDTQYREVALSEVKREGNGYAITCDDGTLWIDDPGFEPRVGDRARFYGQGFGAPVRGVVIGGRLCHYQTPEEFDARQKEQIAKWEAERAAITAAAKAAGRDEATMRAADVPWFKTLDELTAYISGLSQGPHDYGTCCYAVSMAAVATFNYMASQLGITGFQASCADLDMLRRTRHINGPFLILKGEDALYPQHDLPGRLAEAMEEWRPWLAEQAAKRLETDGERAHPRVVAHWRSLVPAKVR